MMYHLASTDPDNYGRIRFTSSLGSIGSTVLYRVNSLSTFAAFSVTTPEDFLTITTTIQDTCYEFTLTFQEHGAYDLRTLAHELNKLTTNELALSDDNAEDIFTLTIALDNTSRLVMTANQEFTITQATHRAKLLLGLYDTTLPVSSEQKQFQCPSVPYVSYGSCLYLCARTDFVSTLNVDGKEITRSIAYKVNELLFPGAPVICKLPGQWSVIHSDQLGSLSFELVDFQLQPVILHAPLCLTLEVERLEAAYAPAREVSPQAATLTNLIET